jgi:small subunit ribosomal protein S20
LANTKSAEKQIRQNERRRARNRWFVSRARTFIKKALRSIETGDLEAARIAYLDAQSALDTAAEKGIIHKNNAARRKSRLAKRLREADQGRQATA